MKTALNPVLAGFGLMLASAIATASLLLWGLR